MTWSKRTLSAGWKQAVSDIGARSASIAHPSTAPPSDTPPALTDQAAGGTPGVLSAQDVSSICNSRWMSAEAVIAPRETSNAPGFLLEAVLLIIPVPAGH